MPWGKPKECHFSISYEGIYDLLMSWNEEESYMHKIYILLDIMNLIDECESKGKK